MRYRTMIFWALGVIFGIGLGCCLHKNLVWSREQHLLLEIEEIASTSDGWQSKAEHYGSICKWLLEKKPIYGSVVMDSNSILTNCLIVSGGEFGIEIAGDNSTVMNCNFRSINMDWVNSITAEATATGAIISNAIYLDSMDSAIDIGGMSCLNNIAVTGNN